MFCFVAEVLSTVKIVDSSALDTTVSHFSPFYTVALI